MTKGIRNDSLSLLVYLQYIHRPYASSHSGFDLLTDIVSNEVLDGTVFIDRHARHDLDPGADADIANLAMDDVVSVQRFDGSLNLNALAIGLGLEDVAYEPEAFAGLVYDPDEYEATAILFGERLMLAVGETEMATTEMIHHTLDTLDALGLGQLTADDPIQTGSVDEFV